MVQPHVIQQKLLALREDYLNHLPANLSAIADLWASLSQHWDKDTLATLQRQAHSLAGSGATFGFTGISSAALELDTVLKQLHSDDASFTALRESIAGKISALKQAGNKICNDSHASVDALTHLSATRSAHDIDTILLINVNTTATLDAERLQQYHYHLICCQLQTAESVTQILQLIKQHNPTTVIYDIDDYSTQNMALIDAINQQLHTDIPKLFISHQSGISSRLAAVRHGSDAFFLKPVEVAALADKIDSYGRNQDSDPYSVMIIDDSPDVANAYALHLQLSGMRTMVVTDPLKVCDALCEFTPDLILLDMYMPDCSGPELAMVIRQQGAFTSVPIVFLSIESDIAEQLNAMRRGGDDFLTKPITPDHLVSAVKIRAKRYRDLRVYMFRDSLSGLLNHSKIVEQLQIEISRAERSHEPLAYVMIDIDRFKSTNDTFGHAAGDQVIRSLAHLLRRSVRSTDVVGRYGGEEFAIILYGADWEPAFDVMENLRKDFEKIEFVFNNQTVHITFSCGIAVYPAIKHIETLQGEADRALYQAKNQGRNCTVLANSTPKSD